MLCKQIIAGRQVEMNLSLIDMLDHQKSPLDWNGWIYLEPIFPHSAQSEVNIIPMAKKLPKPNIHTPFPAIKLIAFDPR